MNPKNEKPCSPTIRNYRPEDHERLRKLKIDLEQGGQSLDPWSWQDLEECLAFPNRLRKSNAFVAETEQKLIAFLKVKTEPDLGRIVLSLVTHPRDGKKNLLRRLLQEAIFSVQASKAERVHINLPRGWPELKSVLLKMGFRPVRRYVELRLDLLEIPIPRTSLKVAHIHPFQRGEESRLAWIQNRAFSGTWGYSSNTPRDIVDRTLLPGFSPEDVLLAFVDLRLVGFCWTMVTSRATSSRRRSGRVFMVGVAPGYRGRGVGKQLLLAGLSRLKRRRIQRVDLTMDSENDVARSLYRSLGFRQRTSTVGYEKSLP